MEGENVLHHVKRELSGGNVREDMSGGMSGSPCANKDSPTGKSIIMLLLHFTR